MESEFVYAGSKVHVGERESENNQDNIQIEREEGFVLTDTKAQCKSVIIQGVVRYKEREFLHLCIFIRDIGR